MASEHPRRHELGGRFVGDGHAEALFDVEQQFYCVQPHVGLCLFSCCFCRLLAFMQDVLLAAELLRGCEPPNRRFVVGGGRLQVHAQQLGANLGKCLEALAVLGRCFGGNQRGLGQQASCLQAA